MFRLLRQWQGNFQRCLHSLALACLVVLKELEEIFAHSDRGDVDAYITPKKHLVESLNNFTGSFFLRLIARFRAFIVLADDDVYYSVRQHGVEPCLLVGAAML